MGYIIISKRHQFIERIVLVIIAFIVLTLFPNCGKNILNGTISAKELVGYINLENQSEHSGILVQLVELDSIEFTDSIGYFNFGQIPDGSWTLKAKYPYFSSVRVSITVNNSVIQDTIDIFMRQKLQFWGEPVDTSISMDQGNSSVFTFKLQTKLVNITDSRVTLRGALGPRRFFAISPKTLDWPYVSNPDNIAEFCYESFEWFGSNDAIDLFQFDFEPRDTISFPARSFGGWFLKSCFNPGAYFIYSAPSDEWNYPEYFDPAYFWDREKDIFPPPEAWEKSKQLNKTLLLKRELFQPATINLTN